MKKQFQAYMFITILFLAIGVFIISFSVFSLIEQAGLPKGKDNWQYEDGTIISSVKITTGCMYTLSSGMTFTDKGCRYNNGEIVEPYKNK